MTQNWNRVGRIPLQIAKQAALLSTVSSDLRIWKPR